MDLPDWLARFAAVAYRETYKADLPPDLAATLTADALAGWLADLPAGAVETLDYVGRRTALVARVSAVTLAAAMRSADALNDLAATVPTGWTLDRIGHLYATADTPPAVDFLEPLHALWEWAHADVPKLRHPLAPLVRAWLDAHRPTARADRWPRATMPRMVTAERAGQPARIEVTRAAAWPPPPAMPTLPDLGGPLDTATPPDLAYLPGLEPPDATPAGVVPAAWLALIDGMAGADRDAREWQRSLRLLIEVVSAPDPRARRGVQRVRLPVGGPDGIIRRLWPNDGRVREHYPALRRALGLAVSAALPASDGRAFPAGSAGPLAAGRRAHIQRDVSRWRRRRRL